MARHGVRNFIFSSTAAIFGNPLKDLIDEAHLQAEINPYVSTKRLMEQLLPDYESPTASDTFACATSMRQVRSPTTASEKDITPRRN